jgi:hypothetical protein
MILHVSEQILSQKVRLSIRTDKAQINNTEYYLLLFIDIYYYVLLISLDKY